MIAGSYGNSPQALNVMASQQPAAIFDSSEASLAYTKHVQPIWGHAGLGLPASPMEQPGADKNGNITSGTVNNLNLYGGAPVDKVGDGKGISPAMFGVSATTYQEVPGSKPRPIGAPGYPYAEPNAGAGSPHSTAFGPKHNHYFIKIYFKIVIHREIHMVLVVVVAAMVAANNRLKTNGISSIIYV